MTTPTLLTVEAAAERLGLPKKSLLRAAEALGHVIRVGRAIRIPEAELQEIIDKCRSKPKAPASTSSASADVRRSGSSETPTNPSAARAQQIARKLKGSSPRISKKSTEATVVPMPLRK